MSTEHDALSARIDELEFKLAYQENLVGELNDVLVRYSEELKRMQQYIVVLQQKLESIDLTPGGTPDNEVPPHY